MAANTAILAAHQFAKSIPSPESPSAVKWRGGFEHGTSNDENSTGGSAGIFKDHDERLNQSVQYQGGTDCEDEDVRRNTIPFGGQQLQSKKTQLKSVKFQYTEHPSATIDEDENVGKHQFKKTQCKLQSKLPWLRRPNNNAAAASKNEDDETMIYDISMEDVNLTVTSSSESSSAYVTAASSFDNYLSTSSL